MLGTTYIIVVEVKVGSYLVEKLFKPLLVVLVKLVVAFVEWMSHVCVELASHIQASGVLKGSVKHAAASFVRDDNLGLLFAQTYSELFAFPQRVLS